MTGGPTAPPEAARAWAEQHQQLSTDKYHPEASPDFSDQAVVYNEHTGQNEITQVKPRIEAVRQGKAKLLDPDALGTMYTQKVADAMKSGTPTTEAFVQADKAVRDLNQVRTGYMAQDLDVGHVTPEMRDGMRIVQEAQAHSSDASFGPAADAQLRQAGFDGGLPEFMSRMQTQFGSLKMAKPK
jgi:hypothetical protein